MQVLLRSDEVSHRENSRLFSHNVSGSPRKYRPISIAGENGRKVLTAGAVWKLTANESLLLRQLFFEAAAATVWLISPLRQ
jgi:hypothetical protein